LFCAEEWLVMNKKPQKIRKYLIFISLALVRICSYKEMTLRRIYKKSHKENKILCGFLPDL
jgi:hypothetical protein